MNGAAGAPELTCSDWRGWSAHRIAPLLQRETDRWAREFHWDQRWSMTHVESAREDGRLPGLVVTDADGRTRGWTFFLRRADQFQLGMLVSDTPAATRALVDAALESPLADEASIVVFSPEAPGLDEALHAHGIRTECYDYLAKGIAASPRPDNLRCRASQAVDLPAIAELLGEAYRETTFLRPFVTSGEPADWRDYLGQLVDTAGCGEFLLDASSVADDVAAPRTLCGALLATRLNHDTGHIAQVVVSPRVRGGGIARDLLRRSISVLRKKELVRAKLLVASTNTAARRLYDAEGFQPAGTFLTGIK